MSHSPRRYAVSRVQSDANHGAIAHALRQCGASVVDLRAVGAGVPDLLVGYRGASWLLEVKTDAGKLRESQDVFAATWRGGPVVVVRSPAEALVAIGVRIDT